MIFVLIASIPDRSIRNMSNKALINIHNDTFINHQIKNILKIHKRAKVFVVCAFESKKILDNMIKNNRVFYIQHKYNDYSNIGESLKAVINYIPEDSCINIINLSMTIDPLVMKKIKFQNSSIIINRSPRFKSKIGCTINANNNVEFVFYDLPNKICEYLYISKKDNKIFRDIVKNHIKNNMYLFEIINSVIQHHIAVDTININTNIIHFNQIDQITNIKNLFRKLKNVSTI